MNEVLKYRIPGKKVVSEVGSYKEVSSFEGVIGFVIASFDKSKKYEFIGDGKLNGDNYYREDDPVCCSKDEYIVGAEKLLTLLREGQYEKVVYSRIKKIVNAINPEVLFDLLCEQYPSAFIYLISSPHFGTWVGASPEKLIESYGVNAKTVALAGTKKTTDTKSFGDKERSEQNYVTTFMEEVLGKNLICDAVKKELEEVDAGPVKHLANEFEFFIEPNKLPALIDDLHPTPAVSGVPRDASIDLIKDLELHDRSLYAGYLGVINDDSAALYVNLRCAEITASNVFMYVGGGYTIDSQVEQEWLETENKSRTLLDIIEKM